MLIHFTSYILPENPHTLIISTQKKIIKRKVLSSNFRTIGKDHGAKLSNIIFLMNNKVQFDLEKNIIVNSYDQHS